MTPSLRAALDQIPEGYSHGLFQSRRYGLTKTTFSTGRSLKFFAQELGGPDFISLNLYFLATGETLKPCEMPEDKVIAFVLTVTPIPTASG